ncbi:AAA family ATPase [Alkalihalophilus lindianensis]|uniref:AAA family ATPase n=1 Tax=Alkalihalophilus lindianensis TaxID=1630542 RepID=A0ABU3X4C6_9BACI|nr:AAA family ATPase [Alkalihalophilus lindianensis]MDV2682747.1 AAA family ATPase [Alkalihalophilus lindianensis]
MAIIFVTGLSGVGKSSVLKQLEREGYNVVDTDYGYIKVVKNGEIEERVWDEEKITQMIEKHKKSHLFMSGCYSNQSKFYDYFDNVVLLKAELKVMIDRINNRTSHNYGKSPEEKAEVIDSYKNVLPLLENSAGVIIDTTNSGINIICRRLIELL